MRPIVIVLEGEYWDSYLYDDRLLLFSRDGTLRQYRWDRLLSALIPKGHSLSVPFRHLAGRGRAWYSLAVRELIEVDDVRQAMQRKAEVLAQSRLHVSLRDLSRLERNVSELELFPSTDVEVWGGVLFVGSTDGVTGTPLRDLTFELNGDALGRSNLFTDAPALSLAASYRHLAVANGSEGLSEFRIDPLEDFSGSGFFGERERREVSAGRCDLCGWASFDIVGSVTGAGGYIGAFTPPRQDGDGDTDSRQLLGTIASEELFGRSGGFLFGGGQILALASSGALWQERWNPFRRRADYGIDMDETRLTVPSLARSTRTPDPLNAVITVFGVVLELDSELVVYGSDGRKRRLVGEPVSWRAFPRSQRYMNQLHVVRDDCLEIYVFAHDYFVPRDKRSLALDRPKASTW